jgi:elongator complex protein 5
VDVFVKGRGRDLTAVRAELISHYPPLDGTSRNGKPVASKASLQIGLHPGFLLLIHGKEAVVVLDSLNALATSAPHLLTAFLSAIVTPAVSVVAIYHADVPLVLPRISNEYEPPHLTVLCHLATAILRVTSLHQEVERQKARNRSVQEPEWGLREGREGVLVGLRDGTHAENENGIVLKMELRRRSGRAVTEKFVILSSMTTGPEGSTPAKISLLSDHPGFRPEIEDPGSGVAMGDTKEPESTFNLGLTDKQRRDRDEIVLPYFDAQTDIGAGEGGRILYEMGREDDFDDEDDEI